MSRLASDVLSSKRATFAQFLFGAAIENAVDLFECSDYVRLGVMPYWGHP